MTKAIQATGRIKWFQIGISIIMLSELPLWQQVKTSRNYGVGPFLHQMGHGYRRRRWQRTTHVVLTQGLGVLDGVLADFD